MSLAFVSSLYAGLLAPVPPFTWFGISLCTLDVLATVRLCAVMRQIREAIDQRHSGKREEHSFPKSYFTTFIVVYGGEAMSAPWLQMTPSFLLSPKYPLLYLGIQALIDSLPLVPPMTFVTEGPLTFLDAISRSWLLSDLLPPAILAHPNPLISKSPWALILVTSIVANGGFFLVNACSMLQPGGWSLATPTELQLYGWTTVDLWAAPLITALFAFLTHAQPFWTSLHLFLLGSSSISAESVAMKAWQREDARALCAVILWVLFSARTVNNFGITWWNTRSPKKEVMRSKIDGRRYSATMKKKTQ